MRELRESDGGEITTSGSSTLVRSLLDLTLFDKLNLLAHRVIVGRGKRLAEGNVDQLPLKLIRSTAFDNGVGHQLYRRCLLSDLACSSSLTSSPGRAVMRRGTY